MAASSDSVLPVVTGLVYCEAISACQRSHALDRAREWTAGLSAWCDAQPQLVPFAGACLVHRSEVMQFSGAWSDAFEEAHRAFTRSDENRCRRQRPLPGGRNAPAAWRTGGRRARLQAGERERRNTHPGSHCFASRRIASIWRRPPPVV